MNSEVCKMNEDLLQFTSITAQNETIFAEAVLVW